MTTKKAVKNIPKKKTDTVKEIFDLIKNKKTILIASIKDLPASQFQEIGKKLRGKAIVKVPKKNLIFRAIDESGNEAVKKIKEQIQNSV
ncbi:MAG TPA: 50S ribosomal protein L10, partial [Candidatus Pacearchaeota archaeon]|nr:50S ribosomal protein L10 [Candidatus Pacearchaeota archaeon]